MSVGFRAETIFQSRTPASNSDDTKQLPLNSGSGAWIYQALNPTSLDLKYTSSLIASASLTWAFNQTLWVQFPRPGFLYFTTSLESWFWGALSDRSVLPHLISPPLLSLGDEDEFSLCQTMQTHWLTQHPLQQRSHKIMFKAHLIWFRIKRTSSSSQQCTSYLDFVSCLGSETRLGAAFQVIY